MAKLGWCGALIVVCLVGRIFPVQAAQPDGSFDPLLFVSMQAASSSRAFVVAKDHALHVSDQMLRQIPVLNDRRAVPRWLTRYDGRLLESTHDSKRVWYILPEKHERIFFDGSPASYVYFLSLAQTQIPSSKWFEVSLSAQRIQQRLGARVLSTFPISSGKPAMPTPTGSYRILSKTKRAWSELANLWMPWWMEFDRRGYGIHELPEWPGGYKEGADHLGRPVSHGCIRLGVGPARQMYDWATLGTPVVITQ